MGEAGGGGKGKGRERERVGEGEREKERERDLGNVQGVFGAQPPGDGEQPIQIRPGTAIGFIVWH